MLRIDDIQRQAVDLFRDSDISLKNARFYDIINCKGGGILKETMSMRFFSPIWKCEEIESKLEQLEKDGWRLDKISGFRKFRFIRSQNKEVKYFFTCSFVKESGMIITEQALKSQLNATEIGGSFIELLKTTSVYRITKTEDLLQRKLYRNIYLRHLVMQYVLIGLLFTTIAVAGITLSCIVNKNPLWDIRHLFLAIVGFVGLTLTLRHLFGLFHLREQYDKFSQSNKNATSDK